MSSHDPPFNRIAIVGLGLIGGSIALAVRERWSSVLITAVDRAPVLAHASSSGAIDRAANTVADIGPVDLIILAAPVRQNVQLLPQVMPRLLRWRDRHRRRRDQARHRERGGGAAVRDDVVRRRSSDWRSRARRVRLCPARSVSRQAVDLHAIPGSGGGSSDPVHAALDKLFDFVRGLGARPTTMDAETHDRVMAYVSHLPQLAASALMDVVGRAAASDGLRLAGRGLTDSTRLASSPASVWREVCAANADDIGPALDALIARLSELRADLQSGRVVDEIFDDAARWRAELMKGRES